VFSQRTPRRRRAYVGFATFHWCTVSHERSLLQWGAVANDLMKLLSSFRLLIVSCRFRGLQEWSTRYPTGEDKARMLLHVLDHSHKLFKVHRLFVWFQC
jgi:hypothetical protein